ncbi:hypothetical protein DEO23_12100 [Brachybacterium endophyticum]|uniref:WXG100 family type VII secretion target n=1 Tax=Brachybacterium endophyticum TaxID=2182385 RepID=A0A2U2RHM5_9MICO|nr:DUF6507 family protein [Brachybacterium endophyticum]PWH05331.1 hypothetical protein DEO23_12100 [Brachybacterium endophyticum]
MTKWKIEPISVQSLLEKFSEENDSLAEKLSEDTIQGCYSGLEWGGSTTAAVPEALTNLFEDQQANFDTIMNGISAGATGVNNATIAYNRGQEDMAGTFQSKAVAAADDGDFSYFDDHGYLN